VDPGGGGNASLEATAAAALGGMNPYAVREKYSRLLCSLRRSRSALTARTVGPSTPYHGGLDTQLELVRNFAILCERITMSTRAVD
jgi:hypothetical protein